MNLFWDACEARGPFKIRVTHLETGEVRKHVHSQPFLRIGSDPGADLSLPHHDVSRRHAYLQVINGRAAGVDLGSRTGTRWEGVPRGWGWLGKGKPFQIGPYRIEADAGPTTFTKGAEDDDTSSPFLSQGRAGEALPTVTLDVFKGANHRASVPMSRVLAMVGADPGCKYRVANVGLARFHCGLVRTAKGVLIVDLLGPGGVVVDGTPVPYALMTQAAEVRIGGIVIRISCGASGSLPSVRSAGTGLGSAESAVFGVFENMQAMQRQFIRQNDLQLQLLERFRQAIDRMDRVVADREAAVREDERDDIRRVADDLAELKAQLAGILPQGEPAVLEFPQPDDSEPPPAYEPADLAALQAHVQRLLRRRRGMVQTVLGKLYPAEA